MCAVWCKRCTCSSLWPISSPLLPPPPPPPASPHSFAHASFIPPHNTGRHGGYQPNPAARERSLRNRRAEEAAGEDQEVQSYPLSKRIGIIVIVTYSASISCFPSSPSSSSSSSSRTLLIFATHQNDLCTFIRSTCKSASVSRHLVTLAKCSQNVALGCFAVLGVITAAAAAAGAGADASIILSLGSSSPM